MTARISITWNENREEETQVRLNDEFREMPWICRADCLKDAIYDLEQIYNNVLAEPIRGRES